MAINKKKSTTSDNKTVRLVGLEIDDLLQSNPFELSSGAYGFIWKYERVMNDETLRFVRNAFKGFRDEVQDKMADCLRRYYEDVGPEGEQYLPLLGVEHIDLLLYWITYKIDRAFRL